MMALSVVLVVVRGRQLPFDRALMANRTVPTLFCVLRSAVWLVFGQSVVPLVLIGG